MLFVSSQVEDLENFKHFHILLKNFLKARGLENFQKLSKIL
jgi:hypothetical protein